MIFLVAFLAGIEDILLFFFGRWGVSWVIIGMQHRLVLSLLLSCCPLILFRQSNLVALGCDFRR
jgi:hypothetical protein